MRNRFAKPFIPEFTKDEKLTYIVELNPVSVE